MKAQWKLLMAQNRMTEAEANEIIERTLNYEKERQLIDQNIINAKKDWEVKQEQVKLLKEQQQTEQSNQDKLAASAALDRAQAEESKARTAYQNAVTEGEELKNGYEKGLQHIGQSMYDNNIGRQVGSAIGQGIKRGYDYVTGRNHRNPSREKNRRKSRNRINKADKNKFQGPGQQIYVGY